MLVWANAYVGAETMPPDQDQRAGGCRTLQSKAILFQKIDLFQVGTSPRTISLNER